MTTTQIILNPNAAGGRALRLWDQMEGRLRETLGELAVAITHTPDEVLGHLQSAYLKDWGRVISIGGDGTNHALVNALVGLQKQYPEKTPMSYGMLPVGTGRDWARSRGIPFDFYQAVDWLASATPKPTDIGLVTMEPGIPDEKAVHFLNIASAGLGGEVDARVNRVGQRRPWTFLKATVESILSYTPQHVRITLNGQVWYDAKALLVVVANGTTFGHGMKIAPDASIYDGLFDVVVIEALSRVRVLSALGHVYNGSHLKQAGVYHARANSVSVESLEGDLGLDLDGEYATGRHLLFEVRPGLLQLLT